MADDLILMKLGGSVITNKKSQTPKCRRENITRIAEIISKSNKKIIIVHGAGSYAHPLAKKYKISNDVNKFCNKYNKRSLKILKLFKGYQKDLFINLLISSINRTY